MRGILCAVLITASSLNAQTAAPPANTDFDYLLGDWSYDAKHHEYGNYSGTWSAVRMDGGYILDEYRVLGEGGKTDYMTTTLRAYNAKEGRWDLVSAEGGNGLQDKGTARKVGNEMHLEQNFGASMWRIRYYDIQSDRFEWTADRTTDNGKTWQKNYLQISARRTGPARSLGPVSSTGK